MFKSFLDIEFHLGELDKAGDPLTKLNEVVELAFILRYAL